MQHKLVLSLAGDHLVLELVRTDTIGLGQVLRSLIQRRAGLNLNRSSVARVHMAGPMPASNPLPLLGQALSDLQAQHADALAGTPLDVQLGLDHARIGLVDLSGVALSSLTAKNCDTYAHAWVEQMLHLHPSTAVIRWELLEQSQKLLVSCVGRIVIDALTEFSSNSGLRFSSCRPAVLSLLDCYQALGVRTDSVPARDLAWTEATADGGRSSKVQLLRLQGRHLSALWRGWVPAVPSRDGNDLALDEAIGRFQRVNLSASGAAAERVIWPDYGQFV
jgi:hypothetical protein